MSRCSFECEYLLFLDLLHLRCGAFYPGTHSWTLWWTPCNYPSTFRPLHNYLSFGLLFVDLIYIRFRQAAWGGDFFFWFPRGQPSLFSSDDPPSTGLRLGVFWHLRLSLALGLTRDSPPFRLFQRSRTVSSYTQVVFSSILSLSFVVDINFNIIFLLILD